MMAACRSSQRGFIRLTALARPGTGMFRFSATQMKLNIFAVGSARRTRRAAVNAGGFDGIVKPAIRRYVAG